MPTQKQKSNAVPRFALPQDVNMINKCLEIAGDDGHSVYTAAAFVEFVPANLLARLTQTFKSDGSPKGTLFQKGNAVAELTGVYGLDLLRKINGDLGLAGSSAMGRGTEARELTAQIRAAIAAL